MKEKIKSEIQRLIKAYSPIQSAEGKYKVEAYEDLLTFIDSLEEEPVSNDMEEAAKFYVDTTIEYFDSEGSPCCYPAFIAGAQWQKQQTIDKTCEFLEEHLLDFWTQKIINTDYFIEEFKKAMEE